MYLDAPNTGFRENANFYIEIEFDYGALAVYREDSGDLSLAENLFMYDREIQFPRDDPGLGHQLCYDIPRIRINPSMWTSLR